MTIRTAQYHKIRLLSIIKLVTRSDLLISLNVTLTSTNKIYNFLLGRGNINCLVLTTMIRQQLRNHSINIINPTYPDKDSSRYSKTFS